MLWKVAQFMTLTWMAAGAPLLQKMLSAACLVTRAGAEKISTVQEAADMIAVSSHLPNCCPSLDTSNNTDTQGSELNSFSFCMPCICRPRLPPSKLAEAWLLPGGLGLTQLTLTTQPTLAGL
jgi:hypothetical protein